MKILPELLKSVEFGGGGPLVFSAIMKIAAKLSDDEFELRMLPVVIRLFNSPDRLMRVCLLDNLYLMIDRIPPKELNSKIFPSMTTGFTDTAPVVREQTVKAVLTVVPKLADRTVNGELLRYLAKTANDEQPGIRTNTTICLGKIARNLGTGSRSKVLIAAFTRSLRDPFVHARSASLMALSATSDLFGEEECASRILPALCMPLIDKEKPVRDQASKTMDIFLQRVRKHAASMPESGFPSDNSTVAGQAVTARIGNQSDTSWAGWAISSFTNKLSTAKGQMEPAVTNGTQQRQVSQSASGQTTPVIHAAQADPARHTTTTLTPASTTSQEMLVEDEDVMDAWGSVDDEEDSFFDAPSSKKSSAKAAPLVSLDDTGEPDFAGWLAAQSKAKSKPALPKALNRPKAGANTLAAKPAAIGRSHSSGPTTTNPPSSRLMNNKSVPKGLNPKSKEPEPTDDDWGSAWD